MTKLFSFEKTYRKIGILILILSTVSYGSFAQNNPAPSTNPTPPPTNVPTYQAPVNMASNNSQKKANSASIVSYVMGGGLIIGGTAIAVSNCPSAWTQPMCWVGLGMVAMGVLSTAQGLSQKKVASGAGISGAQSGFDDGAPDKFIITTPDGKQIGPNSFQNQINKGLNSLEQYGAKLDSNTGSLTLPNGQEVALGGVGGSVGDIAKKLGVDEDQAKILADELSKQKKNALAAANDSKFEMIAGGGGASSSPPQSSADTNLDRYFGARPMRKVATSKTAGLTKNIGGDRVGIAQDDIFQMVRRKYEDKKSESFFIEGDWGF
ncbi:MAG: hypothetical protein SGJ18_06320 [Pseudomonadota bacterium]|nr:hypothetical protein [Pseudomonadota bacterium]